MTETQVGELLERATAELRPTTDLVAGGIAAGRRRRRRGLALAAAGTLAAAAVAVGLASLPGGGAGGEDTLVADPSTSPGGTYANQPSAPSVPQVDPTYDGPFPLPPEAMASTLATLLHGTVTNPNDDQYHLDTPAGWQSGAVDLDGASVSVAYQHSTVPRCDGDLARGNTSCVALGGGFFLGTYSAEVTTVGVGRTGVRDIGVTYYTPDGYKISATASNGSSTDPTRPTMDQPVLDLDALTAIAEDQVWR
jgi:hypothetical protein